jgi:hypothetical protein
MMKSQLTLIVILLTFILSAPAFAKSKKVIEELQRLNESQQITNEILEEIREQLANDGACPCFSLAQLNQLLVDYGPFLPAPGADVARSDCVPGTVTTADLNIVRVSDTNPSDTQLRVQVFDKCEQPNSPDDLTNRVINLNVQNNQTSFNFIRCSLAAQDGTDQDPPSLSTTLDITMVELQACRSIAIQWARQNGIPR